MALVVGIMIAIIVGVVRWTANPRRHAQAKAIVEWFSCRRSRHRRVARSRAQRDRLWERANRQCAHCDATLPRHGYDVDHIVALADGGTEDDTNLQILCLACHRLKNVIEAKKRAALRRRQKSFLTPTHSHIATHTYTRTKKINV